MNKYLKKWVVRLHRKKVRHLYSMIEPFLNKNERIMDLGTGSGELAKKLMDEGYKITPVDVVDKVKVEGVKVRLYDGKNLPFKEKEFDTVLLITVLHHVPHYDELLKEVARVSKKVVIVEDIYENWWDKVNIAFWDSVLNLEFGGHPHNNKNDEGWKKEFKRLGFELKGETSGSIRELIYAFKQKAYWVSVRRD